MRGAHGPYPAKSMSGKVRPVVVNFANGTLATGVPIDSMFDSTFEVPGDRPTALIAAWAGWRLRVLLVGALMGCLGMVGLIRFIGATPNLDASWSVDAQGRLELAASGDAALQDYIGEVLVALGTAESSIALTGPMTPQRSPRWIVGDAARARQQIVHERVSSALAQPAVVLTFANGASVVVKPALRGPASSPRIWKFGRLSSRCRPVTRARLVCWSRTCDDFGCAVG